jgi:hypothetical protein
MNNGSEGAAKMTVGLDLGDKYSHLCLIDIQKLEASQKRRAKGRNFPPL